MPDLDFLGVAFGLRHDRVHRRATHSLIVLAVLALACVWTSGRFDGFVSPGVALVWSAALLCHPVLDVLTTGPLSARAGIPLLWPITGRRWYVKCPLVQPPSLDDYRSSGIWRDLLPELWTFGPACVTLFVICYVL
jgi:membrane-bound metal-dependent hydrolase YbcI (DUF457 family)